MPLNIQYDETAPLETEIVSREEMDKLKLVFAETIDLHSLLHKFARFMFYGNPENTNETELLMSYSHFINRHTKV